MSVATAELRNFVRSRAGISMGADKDYLVISRLEPQLRGWDVKNLDALAERLRMQPKSALADQVIAALTTNETLWFRDTKPFDTLRTIVLPEIVANATTNRTLSIWSAACSTGQEVYSLSMLLQEEQARLRGWKTSILGSDICGPALLRAQSGSYTQFEVQRGMPIKSLVRYFEQVGNEWRVRAELRNGIEFRLLNLLELPSGLGPFDIVFCRNVLIYFEPDLKRAVIAGLASRLRLGGYLALGGAETTLGLSTAFASIPGSSGMYRKVA
jgi:chemotaxis protein methyltransferase CheR